MGELRTDPPLGRAYWPIIGISSVTGTPRSVSIEDIDAAEGVRSPAYPSTQRRFRVAFVLHADPARAVTADDIAGVQWARRAGVGDFAAATGLRGEIEPMNAAAQGRRRSVRH